MMASEILNLSALCRCCHTSGHFTQLDAVQSFNGGIESYAAMLQEIFGIFLSRPGIEASHTICDVCIEKLRNAMEFKKQVEECEIKFENYCKSECPDELSQQAEIKFENSSDYEVTIQPEIQIIVEDTNYQSHNHKYPELDEIDIREPNIKENCNSRDELEDTEISSPETKCKHENSLHKERKQSQSGPESKQVNQFEYSSLRDKTCNGTFYTCLTCKHTFSTLQNLRGHERFKHSIFTCRYPLCNITFSTRQLLLDHRLTKHKSHDIYECDICNKIFKTRGTMSSHMNSHTKEKVYKCDVCNKEFHYRCTIIKHLRMHTGIPCPSSRYICDICGHVANELFNLKWHIINVHEKIKHFKCDQCPKEYASNKNLKIHYRTHTGERPFKCQECGKAYKCAYNLTTHKRRKHEKIPSNNNNRNKSSESTYSHLRYTCKVCLKGFNRRGSLALHTWTHVGSKPFKCDHCEKDFVCRYSQRRHMALHQPGGPATVPCQSCHKKFRTKGSMLRHMRTVHDSSAEHNNKPKVKCTFCNRRVFDMEKHIKVHSRKCHQCEFCPKSYSERNVLNRHIKDRHSGITNDCQFCDKKFVQLRTLQKHLLKIHNIQSISKVKNENEKCE